MTLKLTTSPDVNTVNAVAQIDQELKENRAILPDLHTSVNRAQEELKAMDDCMAPYDSLADAMFEKNADEKMVCNLITLLMIAKVDHAVMSCAEHAYVEFGTHGVLLLVEDYLGEILSPFQDVLGHLV